MHESIRILLEICLLNNYIGGRHTPERKLLNKVLRNSTKEQRREFMKDYKKLQNSYLILREKKRTGKDYDWHISLNPRHLATAKEVLDEDR